MNDVNFFSYLFRKRNVLTFDEMIVSLKKAIPTLVNEFGEKEMPLDPSDEIYRTATECARDVQLNVFNQEPKVDACEVIGISSINDGEGKRFVITVCGGANGSGGHDGSGKFEDYLMLIRKFARLLSERLDVDVWLLDWKNDCLDDVWSLRLVFSFRNRKYKQLVK